MARGIFFFLVEMKAAIFKICELLKSLFKTFIDIFKICCFCSIAQLCLTLCDPMDCSTPGFPVLHHLLELAQAHVH